MNCTRIDGWRTGATSSPSSGVASAVLLACVCLLGCGSDPVSARSTEHDAALACDARCDAAPFDGRTLIDAHAFRPDSAAAFDSGAGIPFFDAGRDAAGAPVDGGNRSCCTTFVDRLADLEHDWPLLTVGRETRSFSSFDRTGGDADGFDGTYSALYTLGDGESVIFDAAGPGVLDTLWFTGPDEGGAGLDLGTVRFYLDDEPAPRLEVPWQDLFSGDHAPFLAPLVADNHTSTGGFVSFVPVPYARRLVVTTTKRPGFYQAHYTTLPPDSAVTSFDAAMDAIAARDHFRAALTAAPRSDLTEVPLDVRVDGSGVIDAIQFEPSGAPTDSGLSGSQIQIWWDGETTPSVDAPLAAFFGSGLGTAEVHALAFAITGGVFESRFVMPYWKGFHLVVTGAEGTLRVHQSPQRYDVGEAGYFHAVAHEEAPTTAGVDFQWLAAAGAGKLVGTVLTVHPVAPATKKWWEGDLRSSADGRRTPAIQGTGHEDDHLGGWSDTFFQHPFSLPMNGEPRADIVDRTGQLNANATMYRFFPGIGFEDGISQSTEHGNRNTVAGDYAGVAFYYADSAPARRSLALSDSLVAGDASSRDAHAYVAAGETAATTLSSFFEGRDDRTAVAEAVTSHSGAATFRLAVAPKNSGCFLRRMFDQENGRQGASVLVDGARVGHFYVAEQNTTLRWAERDFFLPPAYTNGKSGLDVEIDPDAGAPAWSVAEYRLLCVVSGERDGG